MNPPDHHVTIEADAFTTGWSGCPATPSPKRIIVSVIDASGQGLLASVSGLDPGLGYALEGAHPFISSALSPLSCGLASGRPKITSFNVNAGVATIGLHQDKPTVASDCDPTSFGFALGAACQDAFNGSNTALGNIYTRVDLCPTAADQRTKTDILLNGWTREALTPDAAGNSTLTKTLPSAPSCLFIGGSVTPGGGPEGLAGYIAAPGQGAASPRAEEVRVAKGQGNINVSWVSRSEIGLAGYKVMGDSKSKGGLELASVSPKGGGGSAAYSVKIDMNSLKGSRSVIVRALLTDGTTVDAAPVGF